MISCFLRPRRGSNSQPLDSKSITLSIELRGQSKNYTRNSLLAPFQNACYNLAPRRKVKIFYEGK